MHVRDRTFPNIVYRAVNSASLFLVTILLSRIAGAENFGILSLFILNATFFNLFTSFGADSSITFHVARLSVRVSSVITYIIGILALQLVFAALTWLAFYFSGNSEYLLGTPDGSFLWLLILLVSISVIEKYTALLNGTHFYTLFSKATLISNLLFIAALTAVLISGSVFDAKNTIAIYTAFSVLQALLLVVLFHSKMTNALPPTALSMPDVTKLFTYSVIAYTANLFQFLAYRMDLWIIQAYWKENEVGLYALAARFAQLLWLVPLVYAGLLFPRVSSASAGGQKKDIAIAVRLINFFNLVVIALSAIVIYWVLPFFAGEEFRGSVPPFLILLPGIFFFSITLILASYFAGVDKLLVNLKGSVACFLLILALDLMLIPDYGIRGAAIASSVGYSLVTFYFIYQYLRHSGASLPDLFFLRREDLSLAMAAVRRFFSRPI